VRCGLSSKLFAHLFVLVSVFVSDNRTATQQLGWRADWASNESAGPGQARPGRRHLGRQGVRSDRRRRRRPLNNWAAAPRGRAVGTTLLLLGDRTFARPQGLKNLRNFEARACIGVQKNLDFINKNVRLD